MAIMQGRFAKPAAPQTFTSPGELKPNPVAKRPSPFGDDLDYGPIGPQPVVSGPNPLDVVQPYRPKDPGMSVPGVQQPIRLDPGEWNYQQPDRRAVEPPNYYLPEMPPRPSDPMLPPNEPGGPIRISDPQIRPSDPMQPPNQWVSGGGSPPKNQWNPGGGPRKPEPMLPPNEPGGPSPVGGGLPGPGGQPLPQMPPDRFPVGGGLPGPGGQPLPGPIEGGPARPAIPVPSNPYRPANPIARGPGVSPGRQPAFRQWLQQMRQRYGRPGGAMSYFDRER